jgi:hypothetical protein
VGTKFKSLRPEELGNQVLEFTDKYNCNKLKTRHKRYMTMDLKGIGKEKEQRGKPGREPEGRIHKRTVETGR